MKILALFLLLLAPAFAETTGTINFTIANATTGLYGHTLNLCNATTDCMGLYNCFLDYDAVSVSTSTGWCNSTAYTYCYHDQTEYSTGLYICLSNVTYRSCSSGVWSSVGTCSSGTCNGGTTACSTSSSSSSGGIGNTTTLNTNPSIIFSVTPIDFNIVQGTSVVKSVTAKNNGNRTLFNVTLSIAGISWYNVSPVKISQLNQGTEGTFAVNFSANATVAVNPYQVTLLLKTSNLSVSASKSIVVAVKASNATVSGQVFPDYSKYAVLLEELERNMTELEKQGADVEELKVTVSNAKNKLAQTSKALEAKDYVGAQQLLDDAMGLIDAAQRQIIAVEIPPQPEFKLDTTTIIVIVAIVAAIAFIGYMMLPPKPERRSVFDALKGFKRLKKKKK